MLILGLCAWRTYDRLEDWRSNEALWRAAAQTAPQLARPMLNEASALLALGRYEEAWRWIQQAEPVIAAHQRHRFQALVRRLDLVWQPVCDTPQWAPWCAWELGS